MDDSDSDGSDDAEWWINQMFCKINYKNNKIALISIINDIVYFLSNNFAYRSDPLKKLHTATQENFNR